MPSAFSRRQAALSMLAPEPQAPPDNSKAKLVGGALGGVIGALGAGIASGGPAAPAGFFSGAELGSAVGGFVGAKDENQRMRAARDIKDAGLSAFATYSRMKGG